MKSLRENDRRIGGTFYKKSCKEAVNYNAPRCLIQALSAVWNNGPKLATDVNDIPNQSPNGYNHGLWAGYLDGVFDP
jgi:hypothetical protein